VTSAILILVILLCSAFDSYVTEKRIKDFGVEIELNRALRWGVSKLGLWPALAVFIAAPSIFLCVLLARHPILLAVYAGMKLMLAKMQFVSEKEAQKMLAQLKRELDLLREKNKR